MFPFGVVSNGRLDALRKKEVAIRAAIAAEQAKQQKRGAKERRRLAEIVGDALVEQAAKSPELHVMLKQILGSSVTDAASRRFLSDHGWLVGEGE